MLIHHPNRQILCILRLRVLRDLEQLGRQVYGIQLPAAGHHTAVWGEILSADIPLSAQLEQPLDLNG